MEKFDKEFERKIEEAYKKVSDKVQPQRCVDCNILLPTWSKSPICAICAECFTKRSTPSVIEKMNEQQKEGM